MFQRWYGLVCRVDQSPQLRLLILIVKELNISLILTGKGGHTEIKKGGTERQTEQDQIVDLKHLSVVHMSLEDEQHSRPIHQGYHQ